MTFQLNYPESEKAMLEANDNLLKELGDDIVFDGFYPYYTKQNVKILFIGREVLGLDGSYIEQIYEQYKTNKIAGWRALTASQFHRVIFYLAYGINNHLPEWEQIPVADKIAETFGEEGGLSFAFTNLSKLSNNSEDWKADYSLINSFIERVKATGKNYFLEQIEILDPDMIVTGNLDLSILADVVKKDDSCQDVHLYELQSNGKTIPIFNLWHFSAPNKSDFKHYYEPLKTLLQKVKSDYNLKV